MFLLVRNVSIIEIDIYFYQSLLKILYVIT